MELSDYQIEELCGHSKLVHDIFENSDLTLRFFYSGKKLNKMLDYIILTTLPQDEVIVLKYFYGIMDHTIGDKTELNSMQPLLVQEGVEVLRRRALIKLQAYTPATVIKSLINPQD